jgi:hypothetical protein
LEKDRAIEIARAVMKAPHIDRYSEIALLARQTLLALGYSEDDRENVPSMERPRTLSYATLRRLLVYRFADGRLATCLQIIDQQNRRVDEQWAIYPNDQSVFVGVPPLDDISLIRLIDIPHEAYPSGRPLAIGTTDAVLPPTKRLRRGHRFRLVEAHPIISYDKNCGEIFN